MSTSPVRAIKFQARYLPILAACAPKNDVRYYLNGFFITPHESGTGAYLVATNGSQMVVIYDANATTNADWICQISSALLKAASKKGTRKFAQKDGATEVHYYNNTAFVTDGFAIEENLPAGKFSTETDYGEICERVIHCEYTKPIDGKYPEFRRVIPACHSIKNDQMPLFNPKYLEFTKMLNPSDKDGFAAATDLYSTGDSDSIIVRFPNFPEIIGIIMPMRRAKYAKLEAIPEWLNLLPPNNEDERDAA